MNNVSLIGRTTADVEIRYSSNGKDSTAIANVTLAIDNPFSNNEDTKTDFIRIKAFGKTAEFMEKYIEKGVRIGLTGRIQTGSYEHKDDYTVYTTDVVASNIYFADGKKEDSQSNSNKGGYKPNKGGYKSNSKK